MRQLDRLRQYGLVASTHAHGQYDVCSVIVVGVRKKTTQIEAGGNRVVDMVSVARGGVDCKGQGSFFLLFIWVHMGSL